MEKKQLAFFAGTAKKRSPTNSAITPAKPLAVIQRKLSARPRKKDEKEDETATAGAKGNWKKVFAFSKFMSLAKTQSTEGPAQLIIAGRYCSLKIFVYIYGSYIHWDTGYYWEPFTLNT